MWWSWVGGVRMRDTINEGPTQISDPRERPGRTAVWGTEELKHRTSKSKTI